MTISDVWLAAITRLRWRAGLVLCVLLQLSACAQLSYYAQATHGQSSVMTSARPIDELLQDAELDGKLRQRLIMVNTIRRFAVQELGLPDKGSYTSYADLKRAYAVWNVVATPELSMQPLQWCFPVAGCVSYRGYYSEADAQEFANGLRAAGNDVQVVGVPAYSTLGWYKDPVLSSFIYSPDIEVARLIFHELAHQVVYVRGDSQFNESFATTVEEAGLTLWLAQHGDEQGRVKLRLADGRKQQFIALLLKYRQQLVDNYASARSDDAKRQAKQQIFAALREEYVTVKAGWHGYAGYDHWFAQPLSNARLAAVATYHDQVPAFRALLREQNDFAGFYRAVIALAAQDRTQRARRLASLAAHASVELPSQEQQTVGSNTAVTVNER